MGEQIEAFSRPEHRAMPVQNSGRSKQDYGTPWELIRSVENRWGKLDIDLAANDDGSNAKASMWIGSSQDYLRSISPSPGLLCWCNPPFNNVRPWAAKWRKDAELGARIIALVPAAIGSNWFADEVYGYARVIALRPRITFEGCTTPYPKDCVLLLYGMDLPGFETWKWK